MKRFLTIFLSLIGLLFSFGEIFALKTSVGDCFLVQYSVDDTGYFAQTHAFYDEKIKRHENIQNILEKHEFNRAFLNLQTVCCTVQSFQSDDDVLTWHTCENNKKRAVSDIPQSVYLFDHFFDILMRKLDGQDFYEKQGTYSGVKADPIASWRYTTLKEIQTNQDGNTNTEIDVAYNKYWKKQNSIVRGFLNDSTNQDPARAFFEGDNGIHNSKVIKDYADLGNEKKVKVNLRDRYMNVCDLASYFYFSNIGWILDINTREKIVWNCPLVVNKRTKLETLSITDAKQSSNLRFMQSTSKQNLANFQQRSNTLQSTLSSITTNFSNVIKLSQKITPNCK